MKISPTATPSWQSTLYLAQSMLVGGVKRFLLSQLLHTLRPGKRLHNYGKSYFLKHTHTHIYIYM